MKQRGDVINKPIIVPIVVLSASVLTSRFVILVSRFWTPSQFVQSIIKKSEVVSPWTGCSVLIRGVASNHGLRPITQEEVSQ